MTSTVLTADVIASEALMTLDNELGWLDNLYRAPEEEFKKEVNGYKIGSSVSIRRPHDPRPRTGATMDIKDVIEGKVALTVDQQVGHDFRFSSSDLALSINDLGERVIKPAVINIVNEIARDVSVQMYQGFYNWIGTAGNAVDSFADFALVAARMDEMSIPVAERNALFSTSDYWSLVGSQTALYNGGMVSDSYRKGELGRIANMATWASQVTPVHTTGTRDNTTPFVKGASQSVSYDTAKNTWTQSLSTDGHDASVTIKAGDVFTIANVFMVNAKTKVSTGILQQFVVTADVTANATTTTDTPLVISPPIIITGPHQTVNAAPADDAAITFVGAASTNYKQNMAFHKNAMALAVVPLEMPQGSVNGSRKSHKGLSCRVLPVYDGINDISAWRLDILYGRKLIDPRLGVRFSGT
jgi:hypothetical protein